MPRSILEIDLTSTNTTRERRHHRSTLVAHYSIFAGNYQTPVQACPSMHAAGRHRDRTCRIGIGSESIRHLCTLIPPAFQVLSTVRVALVARKITATVQNETSTLLDGDEGSSLHPHHRHTFPSLARRRRVAVANLCTHLGSQASVFRLPRWSALPSHPQTS